MEPNKWGDRRPSKLSVQLNGQMQPGRGGGKSGKMGHIGREKTWKQVGGLVREPG